MTDDESRRGGQQRSSAAVELRVAAKLENLAVLRTLVGAVGTFSDLDFDAVADLRLAVDEACTRLISSATPEWARSGDISVTTAGRSKCRAGSRNCTCG